MFQMKILFGLFHSKDKLCVMYATRIRERDRVRSRQSGQTIKETTEFLKQTFQTAVTKEKLIPELEERLVGVKREMGTCKGSQGRRKYRKLDKEARGIQKEIILLRHECNPDSMFTRARPLMSGAHDNIYQREALAMSIMGNDQSSVVCYTQKHRCETCNVDLRMKPDDSVLVCTNCHRVYPFLSLNTDHVDVDYVAQDTHQNHIRSTNTGNMDNSMHIDNGYPRANLYRRFLTQFSEGVPDPPQYVFDAILRELSLLVHMHSDQKFQPTPIATILRKSPELKDYHVMSNRISLMMKRRPGEPSLTMSDNLIHRLMERFKQFVSQNKFRAKKKVSNFRFLTRVFLFMEGEYAKSEMFDNHRTRSVLIQEDRSMKQVVEQIQKNLDKDMGPNQFKWESFRSM